MRVSVHRNDGAFAVDVWESGWSRPITLVMRESEEEGMEVKVAGMDWTIIEPSEGKITIRNKAGDEISVRLSN